MSTYQVTLSVSCLFLGLGYWSPQAHAGEPCTGDTPQHHPVVPYTFDTNSYVARFSQFWQFSRCIYNPDPHNYLRYRWFIPGMVGFVPPADSITQLHYSTSGDAVPLRSCIEYGDAGGLTTAEFLGDGVERQEVAHEDQSLCRPKLASSELGETGGQQIDRLNPFKLFLRIFFPSDVKQSQTTMLEMNAVYFINIKYNSGLRADAGYVGAFEYHLRAASKFGPAAANGGPMANPDATSVKLMLPGKAAWLSQFSDESARSKGVRLKEHGVIELFSAPDSKLWQLQSAQLQFQDQTGAPVAQTQIPVFVPVPSMP